MALVLAGIFAFLPALGFLRDRRRVLLDVRLRNFPIPHRDPRPAAPPPPPVRTTDAPRDAGSVAASVAPVLAPAADRAVLYVDAGGRCTLADDATRALLQWDGGDLWLSDVLAGDAAEAATLLATLARDGTIEGHATRLRRPPYLPVELSAVAVRDRDDNLWGAAIFLRPTGVASSPS